MRDSGAIRHSRPGGGFPGSLDRRSAGYNDRLILPGLSRSDPADFDRPNHRSCSPGFKRSACQSFPRSKPSACYRPSARSGHRYRTLNNPWPCRRRSPRSPDWCSSRPHARSGSLSTPSGSTPRRARYRAASRLRYRRRRSAGSYCCLDPTPTDGRLTGRQSALSSAVAGLESPGPRPCTVDKVRSGWKEARRALLLQPEG